MTLDPTLPRASFQGDGTWKDPVVPFRIFSEEELLVQREDRDPASVNYGVLTTLTRGVDYTVEINVAGDGGFVHLTVAPTTLQGILITSNSVIEQGRSYGGGGAFPSKSHEAALDKLTRISQELSMRQGLALRFPDQDPDSMSPVLPPAAQRVGKVMAFGANGEIAVGDPGGFVSEVETMRDEAIAASSLATTAARDAGVAQIAAEAAAASVPTDALRASNNLSDLQNYSAAATNLGLAIGTDVQAYDADLAALAAISPVQGDILYRNATTWVRLAAGTSGQYLKTLGAGANPAWADVSAGALALVGSYSVGTGTTFDITGLASGYDYEFVLDGVLPAEATHLAVRVQMYGAWVESAYYASVGSRSALSDSDSPAPVDMASGSATPTLWQAVLREVVSPTASYGGLLGSISLINPGNTGRYPECRIDIKGAGTSARFSAVTLHGMLMSAGAVTGVRLFWGGGVAFAGGTVTVYKKARS